MKVTRKGYIKVFVVAVMVLALVRCLFPGLAGNKGNIARSAKDQTDTADISMLRAKEHKAASRFFKADGSEVKNRIYSVPHFGKAFPDLNDVQLVSAGRYGVGPIRNRADAESKKADLVYIGSNPYYFVEPLKSSIPYLVPRAALLLQDIGRSFFDSLQVKQVPLHKIIITSVLRSQEDVDKLRGHNGNATQNSCHLYGTTFDVSYNRYKTVETPNNPRRKVRNDTLKWILSEVLNDMRTQNRCYIKYEVHQGCFHITVK